MKIPSKQKQDAGNRVMSQLMDACIRNSMPAGLGGCKSFDIQDFDEDLHDVILAYINKDIDSITAGFIVMERTPD